MELARMLSDHCRIVTIFLYFCRAVVFAFPPFPTENEWRVTQRLRPCLLQLFSELCDRDICAQVNATLDFAETCITALTRLLGRRNPRLGIACNLKQTNTVLRVLYARTLESPFNENLILSGTGCTDPVVAAIGFLRVN